VFVAGPGATSWASTGRAIATAAAAASSRLARIGGSVHLDFDRVRRNFTGAPGQEPQQADDQQHENDQENDCARHGTRISWLGRQAFAAAPARCIALPMEKLREQLDRPIVLVGLMGAGKSTVGRRLARRLGLPFIDSDSEIEEAVGLPWGEVFERYGEEDYRDGERRLVARLIDGQIRVIATGGGVFVDPRTRELLKEKTVTVWLDAPVDVLAERTGRRDTRPLLKNGDRKSTLERLAEVERAAYAEAHVRVRSGGGAHGEVVDKIIDALGRHLGNGGAPSPRQPSPA